MSTPEWEESHEADSTEEERRFEEALRQLAADTPVSPDFCARVLAATQPSSPTSAAAENSAMPGAVRPRRHFRLPSRLSLAASVLAAGLLLSLAVNVWLTYRVQDMATLRRELTAAQAQVRAAQADSSQWQTRHAELTNKLAVLQAQRAVPQKALAAQGTDLRSVERSLLDQADAAFNQGRHDEAIVLNNAVIRAEPTNVRAYFQAGRAYAAKGRYDDAVAAYNTGLQQNPDSALGSAIYQELGVVYGKQGRDDEAITALREATKLAPHDFYAQQMLGAAYLQKGLQREARTALEEALSLAKTSPGGKELVPSIEAMLSYLPPLVPSPPPSPPPEKFKLTVQATPADSTIKFDNSQLEYRPGMELPAGRYELVVTREGYKTARRIVTISKNDVILYVVLEPDKAAIPRATRRLALIIGNAAYKESPLRNTVNDANDMNNTLKRLGFETTLLRNATFEQMEDAIDAFSRKLRQGGVGLFYYAGHGVQIDGQNYLIPVDAPMQLANVKYRSVAANGLLDRMADAGNELNIVVLDACRENVLMRESRSVQRGLAITQAAQGSFIAYATAPGDVALDRSERNGMYTKHLLRYITEKGLAVEDLFKRVRIGVTEETKGKQIPWESSSLVDDFYFAGK